LISIAVKIFFAFLFLFIELLFFFLRFLLLFLNCVMDNIWNLSMGCMAIFSRMLFLWSNWGNYN
jgi:hypothetical protein